VDSSPLANYDWYVVLLNHFPGLHKAAWGFIRVLRAYNDSNGGPDNVEAMTVPDGIFRQELEVGEVKDLQFFGALA